MGGIGGSGGSGGAGGSEICPGFGDPCTGCLSTSCPDKYCNCSKNADCFAIFNCTSMCGGTDACLQGCLTMFPDGISDAFLVTDCAADLCDAACPGNNPLDPCGECIFETCEDEANTCLSQPACLDLWQCLNGCPPLSLSCQQQCYNDFGEGVPSLEAMLNCAVSMCPDVCGG